MATDTLTSMLVTCHGEDASAALSEMCARLQCETCRIDSLRDLLCHLADSGPITPEFVDRSHTARPSTLPGKSSVRGNGASETAGFADAPLTLGELERWYIRLILNRCAWRFKDAAKLLSIDRSTLYRKLKKYGIEQPD